MKKFLVNMVLFCVMAVLVSCQGSKAPQTFVNPVVYSDVPDVDAIRVGEDYFMISTTMHMMPGAPIMHSKDLVNWEIVSYLFDTIDESPANNLEEEPFMARDNGQAPSVITKARSMFSGARATIPTCIPPKIRSANGK